jgi:sugar-specific transcriptional regulator TrmB
LLEEKLAWEESEMQAKLEKLAFTRLEAKIYVRLLSNGPTKASSLSRDLDSNRVDTYRCLKNLRQRGIVEITFSRPLVFAASEPNLLANILTSEQEQKSKVFKSEVETVCKELEQVPRKEGLPQIFEVSRKASSNDQFTIKSGKQIDVKWKAMIEHSKSEMLVVLSRIGLMTHSNIGYSELYSRAIKRGVRVNMITDIVPENISHAKEFFPICNIRISHAVNDSLRFVIADDKEVMISMGSFSNDPKDFAAIWTNKSLLVKAFQLDFREKWRRARVFSGRLGSA